MPCMLVCVVRGTQLTPGITINDTNKMNGKTNTRLLYAC